ncbi:DNA polymerase III subunit gamma/tau [bacterium]|nr:DNA polymerase III subunit gamma/tau [bacterium]
MADGSRSDYVVIARRYRPQVFKDVVGQRAVVQVLHNEIEDGRIGHGYLFCGPRGTGKTSMARIFAKALNCEHGPTTAPCGKCHHCLEIAEGTALDVIEVDAATYTKVEQTRELLEGLRRAPFSARYKVYIIDEVHMLSNHSFNALLKSLEEPPPHVVFILATTNPEKLPDTVISRCRRCNFERISVPDIVANLGEILDREKVTVREDERVQVLTAIALACEGGLRDAQVLLDQLISLSPEEVTLEDVRSLLGVVESDLFTRLITALIERDTKACLEIVGDLVDRGRDLSRFVKMFLSFLRDAMLMKVGGTGELVRVADAQSEELKKLLEKASLQYLLNCIQQFLDLEERMRGAAPPRFLLEFVLIKLTAIDPRLVIDARLGGDPDGPDGSGGGGGASARRGTAAPSRPGSTAPGKSTSPQQPRAQRSSQPAAALMREAAPELEPEYPEPEAIPTTDGDRWTALVERLGKVAPTIQGVIRNARLVEVTESKLFIELSAGDRAMRQQMERPEIFGGVREAARAIWRRGLVPHISVEEVAPAPTPVSVMEPDAPPPIEEDYYEEYEEEPVDLAMQTTLNAPPEPVAAPALSKPMTLDEAREKFPEFREACELVERHFNVQPTHFNGEKVAEA